MISREINNTVNFKKDWVQAMIEREAIPKPERIDTVAEFAKKWGISDRTYWNQMRKKENQQKIVKLCLLVAKEALPEILQKLSDNAKAGKEKSIEMYLKFIIELSEKINLTSEGRPIPIMQINVLQNNSNKQNNANAEENKSSSRWNECEQDSKHNNILNSVSSVR